MRRNTLTQMVPYDFAKLLNNRVYPYASDYCYYAAGHVTVTWDNHLGTKEYEEGDFIDDGDNIHGDKVIIPSYADVLDWLWIEHHIVVELKPAFTFALEDRVAYYVKAYHVDEKETGTLIPVFENNLEMYSFELAIYEITKKLIEQNII